MGNPLCCKVLDGFPKTRAQAEFLRLVLESDIFPAFHVATALSFQGCFHAFLKFAALPVYHVVPRQAHLWPSRVIQPLLARVGLLRQSQKKQETGLENSGRISVARSFFQKSSCSPDFCMWKSIIAGDDAERLRHTDHTVLFRIKNFKAAQYSPWLP